MSIPKLGSERGGFRRSNLPQGIGRFLPRVESIVSGKSPATPVRGVAGLR